MRTFFLKKSLHVSYLQNSLASPKLRDQLMLSDFLNGGYGTRFKDTLRSDNFSTLSSRAFWWLLSICPGHIVYKQDNMCYIESYTPSRFIHQFCYAQLYVGNPNKDLAYQGNLFEVHKVGFTSQSGVLVLNLLFPRSLLS